MKRTLCFLLVFSLTIVLAGCGKKIANTEDEMLEIIIKELDLDIDINLIDIIDLNDRVLVCYMTGDEYQVHTYGYAEFKKDNNRYEFLNTHSTIERGVDLRSAQYLKSYFFIINNEKCQYLSIRIQDGREKMIKVDKIPFIYFFEDALNDNFEYLFLDENRDVLLP